MSTGIEWTDEVWNPVVGCSRVSAGCDNCYAIGVAHRAMQPAHHGLTVRRPGERPDWSGTVRELDERLNVPFRWKTPRRVFVNSMSDLFHPQVSRSFIADVWAVMALTPQHTYQILTKRPRRMASLINRTEWRGEVEMALKIRGSLDHVEWQAPEYPYAGEGWLPNVWLGTSIEDDKHVDRAWHLRDAAAAVRFLSLEPLIGPVPSLAELRGIDWVIVGGESGPGARPMHPQWVRDVRDRCVDAGVPFFFKQWGGWVHSVGGGHEPFDPQLWVHSDGRTATEAEALADGGDWTGVWRVGKKAAGRILDGRTWDEYPKAAA